MVSGEQFLLGLIEDIEVGGPFEAAVAIGPDVVAAGDYFVELIPSLVLRLRILKKILRFDRLWGSIHHQFDPEFFSCVEIPRNYGYFLAKRFVDCGKNILTNPNGDIDIPRFWNGIRDRR